MELPVWKNFIQVCQIDFSCVLLTSVFLYFADLWEDNKGDKKIEIHEQGEIDTRVYCHHVSVYSDFSTDIYTCYLI